MPENLWSAIPEENRSEWIRTAIRIRIARNQYGLKDEYINALNESQAEVRKVGITLNQIARKLHTSGEFKTEIPTNKIISDIKSCMTDMSKVIECISTIKD